MNGWRPANEIERDMLVAAEMRDSQQYARLLMSAQLYVPALPEQGTEPWHRLVEMLPFEREHILAFTSPGTLLHVLGDLVEGYQAVQYSDLAEGWPVPGVLLAVNPLVPIGAFLPIDSVGAIARGELALLSLPDVRATVSDYVLAMLREVCLAELSGKPREEAAQLSWAAEPANDLESGLLAALAEQDSGSFIMTLVGSEVVLPTTRPVSDPEHIRDANFPWRVVGGAEASIVPVFSSPSALERVAEGTPYWLRLPFIDVLANWPSEDHALCFNPGSMSELILPGAAIPELGAAVLDAVTGSEQGRAAST